MKFSLLSLTTVIMMSVSMATVAQQVNRSGSMGPTQEGYSRGFTINGSISVQSNQRNTASTARISVQGLESNTLYMGHVHNLSCVQGGGGHYKDNVNVAGAQENNELWFRVNTDQNGFGVSVDEKPFGLRDDAVSVIIHDKDGARIACGDLY